ncbi:MAG: hypothetical protein ACE5D3_00240 [Candidatus Binatia bacterium]
MFACLLTPQTCYSGHPPRLTIALAFLLLGTLGPAQIHSPAFAQSVAPHSSCTFRSGEGVPPAVVDRAVAYAAELVGAEYFARNYVLVLEFARDNRCELESSSDPISYYVAFDYAPLSRLGLATYYVWAQVPEDTESPVTGTIAAFDETGQVVEPTIDRATARRLVKESELPIPKAVLESDRLRVTGFTQAGGKFHWEFRVSTDERLADAPGCGKEFKILVNATDGAVQYFKHGLCSCPGFIP